MSEGDGEVEQQTTEWSFGRVNKGDGGGEGVEIACVTLCRRRKVETRDKLQSFAREFVSEAMFVRRDK